MKISCSDETRQGERSGNSGQMPPYGKMFKFSELTAILKNDTEETKAIEGKFQRLLRKIKFHLPKNSYHKLYPTGSNPGKFYGLSKINNSKTETASRN